MRACVDGCLSHNQCLVESQLPQSSVSMVKFGLIIRYDGPRAIIIPIAFLIRHVVLRALRHDPTPCCVVQKGLKCNKGIFVK